MTNKDFSPIDETYGRIKKLEFEIQVRTNTMLNDEISSKNNEIKNNIQFLQKKFKEMVKNLEMLTNIIPNFNAELTETQKKNILTEIDKRVIDLSNIYINESENITNGIFNKDNFEDKINYTFNSKLHPLAINLYIIDELNSNAINKEDKTNQVKMILNYMSFVCDVFLLSLAVCSLAGAAAFPPSILIISSIAICINVLNEMVNLYSKIEENDKKDIHGFQKLLLIFNELSINMISLVSNFVVPVKAVKQVFFCIKAAQSLLKVCLKRMLAKEKDSHEEINLNLDKTASELNNANKIINQIIKPHPMENKDLAECIRRVDNSIFLNFESNVKLIRETYNSVLVPTEGQMIIKDMVNDILVNFEQNTFLLNKVISEETIKLINKKLLEFRELIENILSQPIKSDDSLKEAQKIINTFYLNELNPIVLLSKNYSSKDLIKANNKVEDSPNNTWGNLTSFVNITNAGLDIAEAFLPKISTLKKVVSTIKSYINFTNDSLRLIDDSKNLHDEIQMLKK